MRLTERLLAAVEPGNGGPTTRRILRAIGRNHGYTPFDGMVAAGELVMTGRKDALYGRPIPKRNLTKTPRRIKRVKSCD